MTATVTVVEAGSSDTTSPPAEATATSSGDSSGGGDIDGGRRYVDGSNSGGSTRWSHAVRSAMTAGVISWAMAYSWYSGV